MGAFCATLHGVLVLQNADSCSQLQLEMEEEVVVGLKELLLTALVSVGNKYAITNESRTKTARLFFAQGCELEAMQMEVEEERAPVGSGRASAQR
jgi:hypothetical protein